MSTASFDIDAAAGIVTALTGLVAAVAATTQLSYRYRMMRAATWAQEQISSASVEQKRSLENMQRWAQSEVVAATIIPSRVFVEPFSVAALLLLIPILHDPPVYPFALTAFLTQTFEYRRTIRLYIERRRCAADYYEGRPTKPAHIGILFQMEGSTRKEFLWASIISIGLTTASLLFAHYIYRGQKMMFLLAISIFIGTINSVLDIRRKHRHPYFAHI